MCVLKIEHPQQPVEKLFFFYFTCHGRRCRICFCRGPCVCITNVRHDVCKPRFFFCPTRHSHPTHFCELFLESTFSSTFLPSGRLHALIRYYGIIHFTIFRNFFVNILHSLLVLPSNRITSSQL